MDRLDNPFAPGAGTQPPELAGRDEVLDALEFAALKCQRGGPARCMALLGLRGVGKTVVLGRVRDDVEDRGLLSAMIEASEARSLPSLLAPELRRVLLKLSGTERRRAAAQRAMRALAGFVSALKVRFEDLEFGLDVTPELGLADSGDLEFDLTALLEAVGDAAKQAETALILIVDELQYAGESELGALVAAFHRAAQRGWPIMLAGAGLPQLRGRLGKARSYAERLFEFRELGALEAAAARAAVRQPLRKRAADIEDDALKDIVDRTRGYPYFLQEWGLHAWNVAPRSPIRSRDVRAAEEHVTASLDQGFFRVRYDRLTPAEKRYMRAMAGLGPGPHRSGEIASILDRRVTSLGPLRSKLIGKGMIWSPSHGDTAFTVPSFDKFMKRMMPGDDW